MLRLERPGFLAAARAETGVEPLREGERLRPFVAALGERACPRVVDPFAEGGSAVDDLPELTGAPGLRGVADIVQGPGGLWPLDEVYSNEELRFFVVAFKEPAFAWEKVG